MSVGTALYKIKVMPESPEMDLEALKQAITSNISALDSTANVTGFEIEPIAFGLKALIVAIRIVETIDSSKVEEAISSLTGISSVQVIDYRRAIN